MGNRIDKARQQTEAQDLLGTKLGGQTDIAALVKALVGDEQELASRRKDAPSMKKELSSLPAILTALAAAAGAASGRPDIASGLAQGFIGQSAQNVALETRANEKAIDQKASDIAQKRSALGMVFQANPEAFVDTEGKATIDANVLGYALTGLPIAISPNTRLAIQETNRTQLAQIDAARTMFTKAETDEQRQEAVWMWNGAANLDLDKTQVEAVSGADSLDSLFMTLMGTADGNTVLDAWLKESAQGVTSTADPRFTEIMSGVRGRDYGGGASVPEAWETAGQVITEWAMADPTVRLAMDPLEQAEAALSTRPDLLAEFKKRYDSVLSEELPITGAEYLKLYNDFMVKILQAGNFSEALVEKLSDPEWAKTMLQQNIDVTVNKLAQDRRVQEANGIGGLFDYGLGIMSNSGREFSVEEIGQLRDRIVSMRERDLPPENIRMALDTMYGPQTPTQE